MEQLQQCHSNCSTQVQFYLYKIFRSICIAAGLNKFTTVATGYT